MRGWTEKRENADRAYLTGGAEDWEDGFEGGVSEMGLRCSLVIPRVLVECGFLVEWEEFRNFERARLCAGVHGYKHAKAALGPDNVIRGIWTV